MQQSTQKMDLATEPDMYSPSINNDGIYIDIIPSFRLLPHGLRCPCGSRKDKAYTSPAFSTHIKTKTHQTWLSNMNANRMNYYVENEELKHIVQNQRLIIAKLEKELQHKTIAFDCMAQQLIKHKNNIDENITKIKIQ